MKVATDEDARDCRNNDEERDERGGGERQPDDVALPILDEGERERLPSHRIFRIGTAVRVHDADGARSGGVDVDRVVSNSDRPVAVGVGGLVGRRLVAVGPAVELIEY